MEINENDTDKLKSIRKRAVQELGVNLLNKNVFHKITDSSVLKSENSLELRGRTFLVGIRFRII